MHVRVEWVIVILLAVEVVLMLFMVELPGISF
jgi:hypothetical protein